MIKNLAVITFSGEGMSIAKRFKDSIGDKGQVLVGIIEDQKDIYTIPELEAMIKDGKDPSKEEEDGEDSKESRLSLYEGILDIKKAHEVVAILKDAPNKDEWFVFCDMNNCFKFATELAEFMPHGLFPTGQQRALEVDREAAKKFIEDNYPDVAKEKHWEFANVTEAEKFLNDCDEIVVMKGNNGDAPTIVPPTDDLETAKEIIRDALVKNKANYNSGGLIFEVKLDDAIELTPECVYYDGELVYCSLDVETKRKYAGDVGSELVGCGTDMVISTEPKDKLNKIAFPKIVSRLADDAKGMFVWDLSVLISKTTGKIYPGEFCANRVGWDDFHTQMSDVDPVMFFNDIVEGKNPLRNKKYSCSLRVFNDEKEQEGIKIIVADEVKEHVWLMDAKMKDGEVVTAGYTHDVAVITGSGETFRDAVNALYDHASKFALATKRWGYRSKGDYLDGSYMTSIVNRYNYGIEKGLITGYEEYLGDKSKSVSDLEKEHADQIAQMKKDHREDMKSLNDRIEDILKE